MNYLLDTNIIVAILRNKSLSENTINIIKSKQLCMSVISYAELIYGIEKYAVNKAKRKQELRNLATGLGLVIIPLTCDVVEKAIETRIALETAGAKIEDADTYIAASALIYNIPIVTSDKHFSRIKGLKLLLD